MASARSRQQTAGQTYSFSYTWNLADAVTAETYPSGRTVNTSYNELNQASAVSGTWGNIGTNYVSQVHYWPHGALYWYMMGNSIERVFNYNSRLQAGCRWDAFNNSPAYYLFQECPSWVGSNNSNNGTLQSNTVNEGGPGPLNTLPAFTANYGYDSLNRLHTASDTGGWSRTFNYL